MDADEYGAKKCATCAQRYTNGGLPYFDQFTKQCVSTCHELTTKMEVEKICKHCKIYGEFLFNKSCISECPRNTITTTRSSFFTCTYCPSGEYVLKNECVKYCGSGMAPDHESVCVDCPEGEYDYLSKCVKTCPDLTAKEGRSCVN